MDQEELKNKYILAQSRRGEIISHFAIIELGMEQFIINSYFGKTDPIIQKDIFQDVHFSFSLLRSIFKKTLKKSGNEALNKIFKEHKLEEVLRQLYEIRNMAAHGTSGMNNIIIEGLIVTEKSEFIIQRDGYYGETNENLHSRFIPLYNKMIGFLDSLPGINKAPLIL